METNNIQKIFFNSNVISELEKLHLNLSHLWDIECLYLNIAHETPGAIIQTLQRKGYITNDWELTTQGRALYELMIQINNDPTISTVKQLRKNKKEYNQQFSEWYKTYPATAEWEDEKTGKVFKGSRPLRKSPDDCQIKYLNILNEGTYSHEDLINALKYQIEGIKEESRRTKENKMVYMQGSIPYLNQRTFESYIEKIKRINWKPISEDKSLFKKSDDFTQL